MIDNPTAGRHLSQIASHADDPETRLALAVVAQARRDFGNARFSQWAASPPGQFWLLMAGSNDSAALANLIQERLMPPITAPSTPAPLRALTAREAKVLHLLAEGLTQRKIALTLDANPRTIQCHVASIVRKFEARGITQAVAMAFQAGLL